MIHHAICRKVWRISLLCVLAGCEPAPRLEPVQGVVVFEDGGPVGGGIVEFSPRAGVGAGARGRIGPDGRFRLTTGGRAGAVAGAYRVVVIQVGEPTTAHGPHAHPAVDPRFCRIETSGLEVRVEPGNNEVTLRVAAAGARPSLTRPPTPSAAGGR